MKLELKHIAPYLPYKLKCLRGKQIFILNGLRDWIGWSGYFDDKHGSTAVPISVIKPILRPMYTISDHSLADELVTDNEWLTGVTKEYEIDQLVGVNLDEFLDFCFSYHAWQKLFENHFDVFGLIDAGLAIDINTIQETV